MPSETSGDVSAGVKRAKPIMVEIERENWERFCTAHIPFDLHICPGNPEVCQPEEPPLTEEECGLLWRAVYDGTRELNVFAECDRLGVFDRAACRAKIAKERK